MQEMWVQSLGGEDPLEHQWQPTPVVLPGESHGQRSLEGFGLLGRKESDTTAVTAHALPLKKSFHFLWPEMRAHTNQLPLQWIGCFLWMQLRFLSLWVSVV